MIIDTSALIAIFRNEADAKVFSDAIELSSSRRLSAANLLETSIVLDAHRDPVISRKLDEFVELAEIAIEAVTAEQVRVGREAYRDFGRGSGHPARLNFGDCFSYALAKVAGEPLLFKGQDFAHTDVRSAL